MLMIMIMIMILIVMLVVKRTTRKNNEEKKKNKNMKTMNESPAAIFMRSIVNCDNKLIAAAVNGHCVGIAVTLLAHCDLVISVEHATFYTPFFQMAIVPEFASSLLFPSIMGMAKANNLLICGEKITARQAYECNLIGEVIKTQGHLPKQHHKKSSYSANNSKSKNNNFDYKYDQIHEASQDIDLIQYTYQKLGKVTSMPLSRDSIAVFKKIMRQHYMPISIIKDIIKEEFKIFDQRIINGDVFDAVLQLLERKRERKLKEEEQEEEAQEQGQRQWQGSQLQSKL